MLHAIDGVEYLFRRRAPVNAEKSNQYLLVRSLLGSIDIQTGGRSIAQTRDYSVFPGVDQALSAASAFQKFLKVYGLGCTPEAFIKRTAADNRAFYQDLLAEFSNYFLETERGSHTSAFVHLYRILERLSYSIPLLYCSLSRDYMGTFSDLKAMFASDNDRSGEFGLFNKFLSQGKLIDTTLLDSAYRIDFSASPINKRRHFELIQRHSDKFIGADDTTYQVEIKFRDVPELLRNVRNRFFHFRTGDGQRNISMREIYDTNGFF